MLIVTAIVALALGGVMARFRAQWAALRAQRATVTQFECHSDSEVHLNLHVHPNIEWLVLSGPELTDAGVREAAESYQRGELPHLVGMLIGSPAITDEGMQAIGCMTSLTELYIQNTPITDHGLEPIRKLRNLESFGASNSWFEPSGSGPGPSDAHFTQRGLEYVSRLPKLREVNLSCISLGVEEFKALESLPEGCRLCATWDNVTAEGLRAFKAKRPDIQLWMNNAL
jgi:hypothetical protein